MTTMPTTSPAAVLVPAQRPPGTATTVATVAGRTVRTFLRSPQLIATGAVGGTMFLLLFLWVFGGAITGTGVAYVDYLVPGFLAANAMMMAMNASAGVAADLEQGVFDRFRSLPVSRLALLTGRTTADTLLLGWGLAVTVAVAVAVGFRVHGSLGQTVLALVLLAVFGFVFTWVAVYVGMAAGGPQAAQGMAMLAFPVGFLSSAYVPVETMPGWLQPIAQHQPVTVMVDAVRSLLLGDPALAGVTGSTGGLVARSLAWSAVILAVFVPLTLARFRRS